MTASSQDGHQAPAKYPGGPGQRGGRVRVREAAGGWP